MEWAKGHPIGASMLEGNVGSNDIYDVIGRTNLLQKRFVNEAAH